MILKKFLKSAGRKLIYFNPNIDIERTGWYGLYKFLYDEDDQEEEGFFEKYGHYLTFPMGPTRTPWEAYIEKNKEVVQMRKIEGDIPGGVECFFPEDEKFYVCAEIYGKRHKEVPEARGEIYKTEDNIKKQQEIHEYKSHDLHKYGIPKGVTVHGLK